MASQADPSAGPIDRIVGAELRRHRQRLGLSQAEVARTLGVSEKTWSRHEAGVRIPFVRLARFCDAYVFSIESLYARLPLWTDGLKRPTSPSSPPGVAESDVDFIPRSDGDILLDLFNRLSPPERKIVLSAAHGIARKL